MISRHRLRPHELSLLWAFLLLAVVLSGCKETNAGFQTPRLVLLFATCTVSTRYLSPYDPAVPYTPELADFARDASVFMRHETEAGSSGIAFASLFSGLHTYRHGIYRHPARLDDAAYLIAESFADAGYETFFWSGHNMAAADLNYGQGVSPANTYNRAPVDGTSLSDRDPQFMAILERLKVDPSYRAFVQTNFTQTHAPYVNFSAVATTASFCRRYPGECQGVSIEDLRGLAPLFEKNHHQFRANFAAASTDLGLSDVDRVKLPQVMAVTYKSTVHQLDRSFGRTLQALREHDLLEQSLIVFTADHGESLYREGRKKNWKHSPFLIPEVLNVPLLIRTPGRGGAPQSYNTVSRSIDVFPTVAALAGIDIPRDVQLDGIDLSPALLGNAPSPRLVAYSHRDTSNVRARDRDLVFKQEWPKRREMQVYDLSTDPFETTDLFDPANPVHMEMKQAVSQYLARLVRDKKRNAPPGISRQRRLEKLRSLGYIQ